MALSFIIFVSPSLNGLVVFAETSSAPSFQPSLRPSKRSSIQSSRPSLTPSSTHSNKPTNKPSLVPSTTPSKNPSLSHSTQPSLIPSIRLSSHPSHPSALPTDAIIPSTQPSTSHHPSLRPSKSTHPSSSPSKTSSPSSDPSSLPSNFPSSIPSIPPSSNPSLSTAPSVAPSRSLIPSSHPSTSKIPSFVPTHSPTWQPSHIPSWKPSKSPSKSILPSLMPSVSAGPSSIPSLSKFPSLAPTKSQNPSSMPSLSENPSSLPTISDPPSSTPSSDPSGLPSTFPSMIPSSQPSNSMSPTYRPSLNPSSFPSKNPSKSMAPSNIPSNEPTESMRPSNVPTKLPSESPSDIPSDLPSLLPSYLVNKTTEIEYTTNLLLPQGSKEFGIEEEELFCAIMTKNKSMFLMVDENYVEITCDITSQVIAEGRRRHLLRHNLYNFPRNLFDVQNTIQLLISFSSRRIAPEPLPAIFQTFINNRISFLQKEMISSGLNITEMSILRKLQFPTPTSTPSRSPTEFPTNAPTPTPEPVVVPTLVPSAAPTGPTTTTESIKTDSGTFIIIIAAIGSGIGALAFLFISCYFIRQKRRQERAKLELKQKAAGVKTSQLSSVPLKNDQSTFDVAFPDPEKETDRYSDDSFEKPFFGSRYDAYFEPRSGTPDNDSLPNSDSLLSNQSLISAGESQSSDSDDEEDDTSNLIDEFDMYKNKNLETMRSNVENAVSDSDAMMSQALTKALMDFDHDAIDRNDKAWGVTRDPVEIESAVLWHVNDWLKKKEGATIDEKRAYMQDHLNGMVASVRFGFIDPDNASRTIHGCAALLGLELAEQIEETTLIVTGMRKTARTEDMLEAFKEFGEIESAAVAPSDRGFGIVRYKNAKFAQRAMERFRTGEIVVQDVAVMIKILKSTETKTQISRQPATTPSTSTSPLDESFEHVETERRGNQYSKKPRGSGSDSDSTRSRGASKRSRSRSGRKETR